MKIQRRAGSTENITLSSLLRARGCEQLDPSERFLQHLIPALPPHDTAMLGLQEAARFLCDFAKLEQAHITVVADYDCDGATSCALAVRGLRTLLPSLNIDYVVPNRQRDGYGLSSSLVSSILPKQHHCLITVDNGIASFEGIALAQQRGMSVIVTDHHLPAAGLPDAQVIVNPNQLGCPFPSKNLAGVGVMFYLLIALRAELRRRSETQPPVNLQQWVDLVALGTVADVVPLDRNNRLLVAAGLDLIRNRRGNLGIMALLECAKRDAHNLKASDLGFAVGPRINAAGRLGDMRLGIECLLTDDPQQARGFAEQLDQLNSARKQMQAESVDHAVQMLVPAPNRAVICAYSQDWHEGLVGLVASRLKESNTRPAFAFARGQSDGVLKGSGRSITGVHLRDVLDWIHKKQPNLLLSFGGHAMAAGLSLHEDNYPEFCQLVEQSASFFLQQSGRSLAEITENIAWSDGSLFELIPNPPALLSLALEIESQIWGQGLPEPSFDDEFRVLRQSIVGEKHLSLDLQLPGHPNHKIRAICFQRTEALPNSARMHYSLSINRWQNKLNAELLIHSVTH